MVAIPKSQGVQQGRTTETGLRPASMAQSQVVPNAISQFGKTVSNVGFKGIQRQAILERKEKEEYQTSQALDARNQIRSFDNDSNIALRELPDNQDTIKNFKRQALEKREGLLSTLNDSFEGDKRLQKVLKQEYDTSKVAFEYEVDQELSRKKKNYKTNEMYSSIYKIKDRYDSAETEAEMALILSDLNETLAYGMGSNLIDAKGIEGIEKDIKESREKKIKLQTDLLEKAQKLRLNDQWGFVKKFDSDPAPEVDFADISNSAETLQKRIEFIDKKNSEYNLQLPILDDMETKSFVKDLEVSTPEESSRHLNALGKNITDEQKIRLAKDVFKENKSIGLAISISDEDPRTAADIIAGNKAIKDKVLTMPSSNALRSRILAKIGKAVVQQDYRQAGIEAVTSIYANKAVLSNLNDTVVSSTQLKESIKQVFGDIIKVNDSQITGFRKADGQFISEDDFEDFFDGLDRDKIMIVQGDVPRLANGKELNIESLKDADLVVVGDGLYTINLFDEFAVDQQGNPFILNLKEIHNR